MFSMRRWVKKSPLPLGEKGTALVESLIAVAIVAIAATAYLGALSTSVVAIAREEQRTMAKALALSQLHHTRLEEYVVAPATYPAVTTVPEGYSVSSDAASIIGRDDNIQRITVTVQFQGRVVYILEDFKANR